MKCYVTYSFAGFICLDENCVVLDYELFPREKLIERIGKIDAGNLSIEEESLLKRMVDKYDSVVIETKLPHSKYSHLKDNYKFEFETPNLGGDFFRSNMEEILLAVGFLDEGSDHRSILKQVAIDLTNNKIRKASESEDMFLIQAINSIEELDETISKLVERLREWYAIHFPEMDGIKNHERYAELVSVFGDREAIINSGTLNEDFNSKFISDSVGATISEPDLKMVMEFASSIQSLQNTKKSLNTYVDERMEEIAPNLRELAGASLGAKLIAHVGGVEKLSKMPSGTVQVLGAEKALFRHLKTGENPPKHGLIFQHPSVRSAKWWLRGKIARTLALKISLAVRKDVYSGDYDPEIIEDFEKRLEEITKDNPFPKRSKKPDRFGDKDSKSGKKSGKKKKKKRDKYKKNIKDYY
ncbi:MAG: ATP-binding protein [Methanobacterium sp.]|nr:ATP-binding protein [Methanobacterium sp.]